MFLSLEESQAAVCSMTVAWLTSQSVLLLSFLSGQTDEWDYLAEGGFFLASDFLVAALEQGHPRGSERKALPSLALTHPARQCLGWYQPPEFHQNGRDPWTDVEVGSCHSLLKDT